VRFDRTEDRTPIRYLHAPEIRRHTVLMESTATSHCLVETRVLDGLNVVRHALPDQVACSRCWTNVPADRIGLKAQLHTMMT